MAAKGELSLRFDTRSLIRIGLGAFVVGDAIGTAWLLAANRLLDLEWYPVDVYAMPLFFQQGLWFGAIAVAVVLGLFVLRQPGPAKVAWDGEGITLFDGETPRTHVAWVGATLGTMTTYLKHSKYSDSASYVGSAIQIRGADGSVIELSEGTQPFWMNGHKTSASLDPLLPMIAQLPKAQFVMRSFGTTAVAWILAIGAYVCAGLGLGALSRNYGNDFEGVQLLLGGAALFLFRTFYTGELLAKTPPNDPLRRRALWIEISLRTVAALVVALPALFWFLQSSTPLEWTEVYPREQRLQLSSDGKLVFFYRPWEAHLAQVAGKEERAARRLDADYGLDHAAVARGGARVAIEGRKVSVEIWRPNENELVAAGNHDHRLTALAISPGGEIVVSGSSDKTAKVWSGETGELLHTLPHDAAVYGVAASGELILTASDAGAFLWDRGTGERRAQLGAALEGNRAVALSVDGARAAVGGKDGVIRIFDTGTAATLRELREHREGIIQLVFSDAGKLASSDYDQEIRVYDPDGNALLEIDLRRDERLREIRALGLSLAFTDGDRSLLVATANSGVLGFDLP